MDRVALLLLYAALLPLAFFAGRRSAPAPPGGRHVAVAEAGGSGGGNGSFCVPSSLLPPPGACPPVLGGAPRKVVQEFRRLTEALENKTSEAARLLGQVQSLKREPAPADATADVAAPCPATSAAQAEATQLRALLGECGRTARALEEILGPGRHRAGSGGGCRVCGDMAARCHALGVRAQRSRQLAWQEHNVVLRLRHMRDGLALLAAGAERLAPLHLTPEEVLAMRIDQRPPRGTPRLVVLYSAAHVLYNDTPTLVVQGVNERLRHRSARLVQRQAALAAATLAADACRGNVGDFCGQAAVASAATMAPLELQPTPAEVAAGSPGLLAPETADRWRLEKALFPGRLSVSFLLQSCQSPQNVALLVDRLYSCSQGARAEGQLWGPTSELIVNVDSPRDAATWTAAANRTGNFVRVLISHNVSELRAYNALAGVARGEILVLLQEEDVPPENCLWVADVLDAFRAWPRTGAIGLGAAVMHPGGNRTERARIHATNRQHFFYLDAKTNMGMQFVVQAELGPLALRAAALAAVGGLNEANAPPGESGAVGDYDACTRLWLAGFHVAHLHMRAAFTKGKSSSAADARARQRYFVRRRNRSINHEIYVEEFGPFFDRVAAEAFRLNGMLTPIAQLPPRTRWWERDELARQNIL